MNQKLYLAAPLFSVAERRFNAELKQILSAWFDVYLPQEDGRLFTELVKNGDTIESARQRIFQDDLAAIRSADVILTVLDGRAVDEGVSFELGYAYSLEKTCWGLQTDVRRLLPIGNNPMIDGALNHVFASIDELIRAISNRTETM